MTEQLVAYSIVLILISLVLVWLVTLEVRLNSWCTEAERRVKALQSATEGLNLDQIARELSSKSLTADQLVGECEPQARRRRLWHFDWASGGRKLQKATIALPEDGEHPMDEETALEYGRLAISAEFGLDRDDIGISSYTTGKLLWEVS